MNRAGLLRRIAGLWPLLPPLFLLGRSVLPPPGAPSGDNPDTGGPGILCLPAALAMSPDPLAGWNAWAPRRREKTGVATQLQETEKIPPPEVPPRSLEVRGRLKEDGGTVYCIYDASASRWHRLEPGHADAEGGLALVLGRRDRLLLHDHREDRIYELEEEPLRLLALPEGGSPE